MKFWVAISSLIFLIFLPISSQAQFLESEGSGEAAEHYVDEYWLQRLIERIEIPRYLMQKAYQLAGNSNQLIDEEEVLTLDSMVPEKAKKVYTEQILHINEETVDLESLVNSTDKFMAVVFYAFRAFGCDQDNIWPSVFNLTMDNLDCLAFNLLQKAYTQSEFTRKYFARAIHFGITSNAPIDHRIHEMAVYQFLLPNHDRVWFNNLKIQFKNSFWNEQEISRTDTYEDNSFMCGSIPFTDEVQDKINFYYSHR